MAGDPLELHRALTDSALLDDVTAKSETVGLSGLLTDRGHRARRVRVPGSAVAEGFRWRLADFWSSTWWPQGVAVGDHDGVPLAMASWYAKPRRGREMGARISVVDLREPQRPTYHHVLLVSPRREGHDIAFDPVRVHAGGIVWAGDRLFVAATFEGIREFRLSDILRPLPRARGTFGYRHVLPERARFVPPHIRAPERMRYSFISHETGGDVAATEHELRLVTGEYGAHDHHRLARLRVSDSRSIIDTSHIPGIPQMQGAVLHDGTWFVSASRGDKRAGDLWVGTPGNMTRHAGVLPAGPEDLAVWPERGQLWSLSEYPARRWMFALDLERFHDGAQIARSWSVDG